MFRHQEAVKLVDYGRDYFVYHLCRGKIKGKRLKETTVRAAKFCKISLFYLAAA